MIDNDLYANRIVDEFLKLEDGDALSINTEDIDFPFAATVARKALKKTNVTVKIVVTENGKPIEVSDFEVEDRNPSTTRRMAMLRLKHVKKRENEKTLEAEVEKDDLAALHKLGHLADPIVTGRRISVPWCVVPVFEDEGEAEEKLKGTLDEKVSQSIRLADYRKQYMSHSDMDSLFLEADDCNLTLRVPVNMNFLGGSSELSDGRKYVNTTDFDRIAVAVDKNSASGTLKGKTTVFGKDEEIELSFENGVLKDFKGSEKLEKLLSFDDELKKVGYISFRDKEFILTLGGSLQDCLKENSELPAYFNTSLYSLKIYLNPRLSVSYAGFTGKRTELCRKGYFID